MAEKRDPLKTHKKYIKVQAARDKKYDRNYCALFSSQLSRLPEHEQKNNQVGVVG